MEGYGSTRDLSECWSVHRCGLVDLALDLYIYTSRTYLSVYLSICIWGWARMEGYGLTRDLSECGVWLKGALQLLTNPLWENVLCSCT